MEALLREAIRGPDRSWLEDADAAWPLATAPRELGDEPEAARRTAAYAALAASGTLGELAGASVHLQASTRARLVNASLDGHEITIEEVLSVTRKRHMTGFLGMFGPK